MKKIKFDIYIGHNQFKNQGTNIIGIVLLNNSIPQGNYNIDGSIKTQVHECFDNLNSLANYITDWLDFIDNENFLTVTIHLNTFSLKKSLKGRDIVETILKIECIKDLTTIKSFSDLI